MLTPFPCHHHHYQPTQEEESEEEEEEEDEEEDEFGEGREEPTAGVGQELAVMGLDGPGGAIVLHEDKKYYPEVRCVAPFD